MTKVSEAVKVKYGARAEFKADHVAGRFDALVDGAVVTVGPRSYMKQAAATAISDLLGFIPLDPEPDHWLENTVPGTTDMTTAVQAWLDYLGDLTDVGRLRPVTYRLTGTVYMTKPVQFAGVMPTPTETVWFSGTDAGRRGNGTWLHFDHTGVGLKVGGEEGNRNNVAERFSGYTLKGFGTFRNQPTSDTGFTPLVCDWDILIEGHDFCNPIDGRVEDIVLWNAYRGICGRRDPAATSGTFGACKFDNVMGQPLLAGIYIDDSFQVCMLTRCRFWVWYMNQPNAIAWTQANGVAFEFGRADGHKLSNCFAYAYKNFIKTSLSVSSDDSVYGATLDITACGGDATGVVAYKVEGRNGRIAMDAAEAFNGTHALHVTGDGNSINMNGGKLRRFNGAAVNVAGTGNSVAINGPTITDHDYDGSGDNAIYCGAGNTVKVLSGPQFLTIAAPAPSAPLYAGPGTISRDDDGRENYGLFSGTTDASGYVNIPHGFTVAPGFAVISYNAGANAVREAHNANIYQVTAANIEVKVTDAAGADVASTNVFIYWQARRF